MLHELSFLSKLYMLSVLFDFDADPSCIRRREGGMAAPRGGVSGREGEDPEAKPAWRGWVDPGQAAGCLSPQGEACPVSAPPPSAQPTQTSFSKSSLKDRIWHL